MPKWLKVTLIVGAVLLVMMIALVATGVYFIRKYGPGVMEQGKQVMEEGETYGRRSDNEGCLTEGISRHKTADGFTELIKANLFLRACLDASRPTPGFCDGVPGRTEFIKSAQWQIEQCKSHGLSTDRQCQQIFQQVQQFCESPRARAGDAGEGGASPDSPPPPPAPMSPPSRAR
ncbi:MAG TPA: hypothetical protein VGX48_16795 [Pyrinomonadaceae bacterium]|jgi:hypothetical protein|nr:hypothetical protein [Pyrinomonadaceae bacterium]